MKLVNARTMLKTAVALETATLAILLINIAAGNAQSVAAAVGPLHGCLYLTVIIVTGRDIHATRTTTALAAVPGIGGLLALRRLGRTRAEEIPAERN
jgi:branched-subunit amino acid permease